MYSKITNPLTGTKVSINSKQGKLIFKKYLTNLLGGAVQPDDSFFDMLEKSQSNRMDDQRASLIPYKQPGIKRQLNSCSNKLVKFIGEGSYKHAYTTNCNKDIWEEEEEFSESFTQNDCNNSVMLITN